MYEFLKSVFVDCTDYAGYIPNKLQRDIKLSRDSKLLEAKIKWQFHPYLCTTAAFWFHLPERQTTIISGN